jgi:uncharacterized protein YgfB (UPF0149 family)
MLDYVDISNLLDSVNADATASSMHGFLCGQICISGRSEDELWQEFMDPQSNDDDSVYSTYSEVLDFIRQITESLHSDDLDFNLMLPDDEYSLVIRTNALADWCHGFLNGFGLGIGERGSSLSEEANEILLDYTKICRVSIDDDGQDNEMAFMELMEYVKVGVIMIFDETNSGHSPENEHETVH